MKLAETEENGSAAVEGEELENTEVEQEESGEAGGEEGDEPEAEEVTVSIGDEESPTSEEENQPAPEWVRELRKSNREKDREIRELRAKVNTPAAAQAVVVGDEPTLEGCEYDTDRFKSEFTAWHERKRAAEQEAAKKQEAAEADRKAWQGKLDGFQALKSKLKVSDFDDAEATVQEQLSVVQQAVILSGAENSAVLVYALGKNPKKLKEFSSITDPVKFAFAVAKLETQLKVTPRKTAPLPESTVRGSARVASDPHLTRLEAEADKTGDRSKLVAYKRQQKQKAG